MRDHGKLVIVMSAIFLVLGGAGCASKENPGGLNEREVGGLAGAGIGAGSGAIIGSATGHAAAGTAIGLPIGMAAGALIGEGNRESKEDAKEAAREEVANQTAPKTVKYELKNVEPGHTKYNPVSGETFPERYSFDPNTGQKLERIQ